MAFENIVDLDHPIHDIRSEAIKNFETKGFPSKKEEAWKYTSLNSLQKVDFSIFPKEENALEYNQVKKYFLHEIDTYKIVFIDGIYSSYLSETTHDGVANVQADEISQLQGSHRMGHAKFHHGVNF